METRAVAHIDMDCFYVQVCSNYLFTLLHFARSPALFPASHSSASRCPLSLFIGCDSHTLGAGRASAFPRASRQTRGCGAVQPSRRPP
eukprot:1519125-Rhodomonas_salina.3